MGRVVSLAAKRRTASRRSSGASPTMNRTPPRDARAQDRDHVRARYRAADRLRVAIRDCMDLGIERHELEAAFRWALDGTEEE